MFSRVTEAFVWGRGRKRRDSREGPDEDTDLPPTKRRRIFKVPIAKLILTASC